MLAAEVNFHGRLTRLVRDQQSNRSLHESLLANFQLLVQDILMPELSLGLSVTLPTPLITAMFDRVE